MTEPATYKTRYLRDPKNSDRVVTLVTKIEGTILSFAFAVNSPPRRHTVMFSTGYTARADRAIGGDRFVKKTGSMIAHGRLDSGRHVVVTTFDPETQHPFVIALTHLATLRNSVARAAKHALLKVREKEAFKVFCEGDQKVHVSTERV